MHCINVLYLLTFDLLHVKIGTAVLVTDSCKKPKNCTVADVLNLSLLQISYNTKED